MLNDRQLTQLQETGVLTLSQVGSPAPSLAELLDACNTLGIEANKAYVVAESASSITISVA